MTGFRWLAACLMLCLALPAQAQDDSPTVLTSRIRKVTVYSDRAQVVREAQVKPGSSATVYAFKKLPGWVDDGSVRVTVTPPEAAQLVDVRVFRDYLGRSTDEEYLKAEAGVQELTDQLAVLDDELRILEQQARQVEAIKAFSLEKIERDAPVKEVKVENWNQIVRFISTSLREIAQARRDIELKRRQLAPELLARQRRLGEMQSLTQLEETSVLVTLQGEGRTAKVQLIYLLPGATWEPAHEFRTSGPSPDKAELTSFAIVSQTSGEDWSGVELAFSTQSSTEINRIPQLTSLTVGDGGTAARLMQDRASSFDRAKVAFENQNRVWNMMNAPMKGGAREKYDLNYDQFQQAQDRTQAAFQRISARGTTAQFTSDGRQTVRGDGNPVRVRIGRASLAARQAIVAVPEQSLNAVRTVQMTNSGKQSLLPGNIALYQDGAFLGMTDTEFVAEGETFAVFLGVADQIKLTRMLDRKHSSIDRKKRTEMNVSFLLSLENLADQAVEVDLADRIPVSENEEIEVSKVRVSGDNEPDSKGLLRWKLTLKPRERKEFRISYRIEYPPALVQRMQKQRSSMKQAMPSTVYDFEDVDVSGQIMQLEESF